MFPRTITQNTENIMYFSVVQNVLKPLARYASTYFRQILKLQVLRMKFPLLMTSVMAALSENSDGPRN